MENAMKPTNMLFVSLLAVALAGCKTKQDTPQIVYKTVNVPVYIVPAPPTVERPVLTLETTSPEVLRSSDAAYVKALAASFEQITGYAKQLEAVYNKYKELAAISAQNVLPENLRNVNTVTPQDLTPKEAVTTDENRRK